MNSLLVRRVLLELQTQCGYQNRKLHPGGHMSLKGGEIGAMVSFSLHMLQKFGGAAKFGEHLIAAGTSLQEFMSALRSGYVMPSPDQMDTIRSTYDVRLRSCKGAGISFSPKFHLACHLVARTWPKQ